MQMINGFPRRAILPHLTEEENAIRNALILVEKLPGSRKLTKVATLLVHAQDLLADCIEGIDTESDVSKTYG